MLRTFYEKINLNLRIHQMQTLNVPENQNNYSLCDQRLGAPIYLHFIILILIY